MLALDGIYKPFLCIFLAANVVCIDMTLVQQLRFSHPLNPLRNKVEDIRFIKKEC